MRKGDTVRLKEWSEFGQLRIVTRRGEWIECQALTGLATHLACATIGETLWIRSKDLECTPPQEETLL